MMKRRFRSKRPHSNGQHDKRPVNPLKHNYESSGPSGRLRGNAQQLHEKYTSLAREALGSGDRVMMENYLQHAEHYQRQINQFQENIEAENVGNWRGNSPPPNELPPSRTSPSGPPPLHVAHPNETADSYPQADEPPPYQNRPSKNSAQPRKVRHTPPKNQDSRDNYPSSHNQQQPTPEATHKNKTENENWDESNNIASLNLPGPIDPISPRKRKTPTTTTEDE